jgi:hypothetical protein
LRNSERGGSNRLALVAPTAADAREIRLAVASRVAGIRLHPLSLRRYAASPRAPLRVVLAPAGRTVSGDLEFLRDARRTILWPPPAAELWGAIAGLRGSHDAPPASAAPGRRGKPGRRSALLLEGEVNLERARRAAASGSPRDWIVERVQDVRIAAKGRDELSALGIRWAVLEPVEVVALVATPALLEARSQWIALLPAGVRVWRSSARRASRAAAPVRKGSARGDRLG